MIRLLLAAVLLFGGLYAVVVGVGEAEPYVVAGGLVSSLAGAYIVARGPKE